MGSVKRQTGCLSFSLNSSFGGLCMKCLLFLQQKRGGVEEILEEIVEERQRGKVSRCWAAGWWSMNNLSGKRGYVPDQSSPGLSVQFPRLRLFCAHRGCNRKRSLQKHIVPPFTRLIHLTSRFTGNVSLRQLMPMQVMLIPAPRTEPTLPCRSERSAVQSLLSSPAPHTRSDSRLMHTRPNS